MQENKIGVWEIHGFALTPFGVSPDWAAEGGSVSMSVNEDKVLVCRDCSAEFVFTIGEQEFYEERGFIEPQRCPGCRAARRQARKSPGTPPVSHGTINRNGRTFHQVTCAACNQITAVPFEPREGRPVYCRECFQQFRPVQA